MFFFDRFISTHDSRTRLLAKNVVGTVMVKGWASVVVFLLVPLTLRCLGEYANGLWMTISAVLVWFEQMDIGLGNGLRNSIATCMARGETEKAREAVSSTIAMLIAIVVPLAAMLLTAIWSTDVYALLNIEPTRIAGLRETLSAVVIVFSSTFVLKIVGNVFTGLQLPAINSLIVAGGQTLTLIGTAIVYFALSLPDAATQQVVESVDIAANTAAATTGRNLMAVAIVNTVAPLVVYIIAFAVAFGRKFPELRPRRRNVSLRVAKALMTQGIQFFVLQIAGIVLFTSSSLLIQHLFSPEAVTPYQITYRYFTIVMMLFGILSSPFWSATTDAFERGEMDWIIKSGRKLNLCLVGLCGLTGLMVVVSPWFYRLWIGEGVAIPTSLTGAMAVYTVIFITSVRYSTMLNGCGKLRLQLIATVTAAVVFIPLSIMVVGRWHTTSALVLTMAAVNVPGLIINMLQYDKITHNTATGIWNK